MRSAIRVRLIDGTHIRVVGFWVGKGTRGFAVAVNLPISSSVGHLFRQRGHPIRRHHGTVPTMKCKYLGLDRTRFDSGRRA